MTDAERIAALEAEVARLRAESIPLAEHVRTMRDKIVHVRDLVLEKTVLDALQEYSWTIPGSAVDFDTMRGIMVRHLRAALATP